MNHPLIAASLSLCVMVAITLYYVDRSATRELPRAEWFPVLDWGWVGCAAAIVIACWARPTRHRLWRWTAAIAVVTVVLGNTSMQIARDHSALMARAQQAEPSGACAGELPVSENRVPLRIRSNTGVRTSARPRFWPTTNLPGQPIRLAARIAGTGFRQPRFRCPWANGAGRFARIRMGQATALGTTSSSMRERRDLTRVNGWPIGLAAERGLELVGVCARYEVHWIRPVPGKTAARP